MNIRPIIGTRFVKNTLLSAAMMGAAAAGVTATSTRANAADRNTLKTIGIECPYSDTEINNVINNTTFTNYYTKAVVKRNKDLEKSYMYLAADGRVTGSGLVNPKFIMDGQLAYLYEDHDFYAATMDMQYVIDLVGAKSAVQKYKERLVDYYNNDSENATLDYAMALSGVDVKESRKRAIARATEMCDKFKKDMFDYDLLAQGAMRASYDDENYTYEQASKKMDEAFTTLMPRRKKEYQEYRRKVAAYTRKFGQNKTPQQKAKIIAYKSHLVSMELVRGFAESHGLDELPKFEEYFMQTLDKATRPNL